MAATYFMCACADCKLHKDVVVLLRFTIVTYHLITRSFIVYSVTAALPAACYRASSRHYLFILFQYSMLS